MSDTTYTDFQAPAILAAWLNDVNIAVYRALGVAGVAPVTAAQVQANLDIATLTRLADPTSAANGPGLIGFNYALGYAAGTIGRWLQDLALSTGAGFIGWIQTGTGAALRTIQSKVADWFSVSDFSGASVAAKLDAAITAAGTNVVLVPASVGAGEPTSTANDFALLDMRGANAVGAGRKLAFNLSDANGRNLATFVNDLHSYTLSSAAGLFLSRGLAGSLPNNRNIEGIQSGAYLSGALTGGGAGFILCATENDAAISSTGAAIGFMWGASYSANYGAAATTTVVEIAGIRTIGVQNDSGSVTPARMYGGIFDIPTGLATKKGSAYFKGDVMANGFTGIEANSSLASAGTIAPAFPVVAVSGVAVISTITPPAIINGGSGQITLVPTGAWTMNTAGNIAANVTAVVGKALVMTYTSGAWYPSYF